MAGHQDALCIQAIMKPSFFCGPHRESLEDSPLPFTVVFESTPRADGWYIQEVDKWMHGALALGTSPSSCKQQVNVSPSLLFLFGLVWQLRLWFTVDICVAASSFIIGAPELGASGRRGVNSHKASLFSCFSADSSIKLLQPPPPIHP